ncbi:probable inactive poly [ADP-ribose] polymerase SRO5 isoform X2 [Rutidosis leptorrhynchoides]|uniref:probable inactive poly [ADP-ribose] polymerase SRO5 isoform X2 n=1 Tax=Rutidosis leptorrhynchoides TaxID=125765 RepID=UPI003A98E63B
MSQVPIADWRLKHDDDNDEISMSSSFGSESRIHVPITQGSVAIDSYQDEGDDYDEYDEYDESSVSDCESVVSGNRIAEQVTIESNQTNGLVQLVQLDESDKLHGIIGKKFVSRLGEFGINVRVECIRRNMFNSSAIAQAKLISFQVYTKALEKKNGGEVNVKYAWFGGSKDEINKIVMYGFGHNNVQTNRGFGQGIVLSADHSPLESVESAIVDGDGMKHILLCRVLLGKTELVNRGSTQCYPSSDEIQTGVDDLISPKKYIVWASQMNTSILPEFVISFTTLPRPQSNGGRLQKPVSPSIPIPQLITALSKILPPKAIKEITHHRRSFIEHKISRRDMIKGIRKVTGDRVLVAVLKEFTEQRGLNKSGKFESITNRLK